VEIENLRTDHQTASISGSAEGEQAEAALLQALDEIQKLKYENMERQQT
jgi:hypothetical protein